jgi:hypothetical protein
MDGSMKAGHGGTWIPGRDVDAVENDGGTSAKMCGESYRGLRRSTTDIRGLFQSFNGGSLMHGESRI